MKFLKSELKNTTSILQNLIYKHNIKTYIELFVEDFNTIDNIVCENKIANIFDPSLMELIETCRDNPQLLNLLTMPTVEHYKDVRDNAFKYQSWYRSAILLFMAKTKCRFEENKINFTNQFLNLKNILLSCAPYTMIKPPKSQSLIYCNIHNTHNIGVHFYQWCRDLTKQGHIVVICDRFAPPNFFNVSQDKNPYTKTKKIYILGGVYG